MNTKANNPVIALMYNMREMLHQSIINSELFLNFISNHGAHKRILNLFSATLNVHALPSEIYFHQRFVEAVQALSRNNLEPLKSLLKEQNGSKLNKFIEKHCERLTLINKDFVNYCKWQKIENKENTSALQNRLGEFLIINSKKKPIVKQKKSKNLSVEDVYGISQLGTKTPSISFSRSMLELPSYEQLLLEAATKLIPAESSPTKPKFI